MQVHALTIRVANSVFGGSVAFVVLCNVSTEAGFHRTAPFVQVSLMQPPAAHAVEKELGTRASGGGGGAMREGHGARSRLAARRTSWWAGRHHHCPCCGSSGTWLPVLGLGWLEPLPLALTGAVQAPGKASWREAAPPSA